MNYDIKISDEEPTDSIWAMITQHERTLIELNHSAVYKITFPKIDKPGLVVTGIQIRQWLDNIQKFSCDIYYLMK